VVPPLSSQESHDLTRSSRESYERARASRDALSESRRGRSLNREVIDGRGSIDSRTFNESHQISGFAREEEDRHDPMIDTVTSHKSWQSRAGQGFVSPMNSQQGGVGFSGGVMSGRADYGPQQHGFSAIPLFLKVAIPVIVVLLVVLVVLLLPH
jgi:hypothetical protein